MARPDQTRCAYSKNGYDCKRTVSGGGFLPSGRALVPGASQCWSGFFLHDRGKSDEARAKLVGAAIGEPAWRGKFCSKRLAFSKKRGRWLSAEEGSSKELRVLVRALRSLAEPALFHGVVHCALDWEPSSPTAAASSAAARSALDLASAALSHEPARAGRAAAELGRQRQKGGSGVKRHVHGPLCLQWWCQPKGARCKPLAGTSCGANAAVVAALVGQGYFEEPYPKLSICGCHCRCLCLLLPAHPPTVAQPCAKRNLMVICTRCA